jgi:hypothetical protein
MTTPFENNTEDGDWPDMTAEEMADVMDVVATAQEMNSDGTESPITGTD